MASKRGCTRRAWITTATEEALAAGLSPDDVLGGKRTRPVTSARWKAWRRLLAVNISMTSLARVSGFDRSAISRLPRDEAHIPYAQTGRAT